MIKVKKGDKVTIRGYSGTWDVVMGADSDGEVAIQDKNGKGWFYVDNKEIVSKNGGETVKPLPKLEPLTPTSNPWAISGDSSKQFVFHDISKETKEDNIMSNRQVATVTLIDTDAGLKPELALVKNFGTVVFDGSIENMKMKLVMDNDMSAILAKHNEKRAKEIDLSIRKATGQELKLMPIELSDLKWVIDAK